MQQIFETSDGSSDIDSFKKVDLATQLNMKPEDLLALHMFSND